MSMDHDYFAEYGYGKAALRKLSPVSEDFRLYCVALLGDSGVMKVDGAVFRRAKRGPRKGELCILVPGTKQTTYVSAADIAAEETS